MRRIFLAATAVVLSACATRVAPSKPLPMQFDRADLDPSVSACTDFYQYTNGGWLAKNPIPPQYTTWGHASVLLEENRRILREVLEAAANKPAAQRSPNEQKIGDFYSSCMNEQAINDAGIAPLQEELDRINAISSVRDLQNELASLQTAGMEVPFSLHSNQDARNSTEVIAEISQDGLGLPNRDYYFKTDDRSKAIRDEYLKHIARMLELAGDAPARAASEGQSIMQLETALAAASMTPVELRDPNAIYNRMPVAQLGTAAPNIDWPAYFAQEGIPSVSSVNVAQPKFVAEAGRLMSALPLEDWKSYLRWHLITSAAGALSPPFDQENFRFRLGYLRGQKQQLPRWQRCVTAANAQIGEALGQAWVNRKFGPEAKQRASDLVENLMAALRGDLSTLGWMSPATRDQATGKLNTFVRKIGYPDQWRDYSALTVTSGPWVSNVRAASAFERRRDLAKIGRPVDRAEWGMTPPTFNAYYNPALNEIVFPAGILQWPMFDVAQDDAFNYGAIGSVIGHEMTHGFDDEGSQYDAQGNLRNWWTEGDRRKFDQRAECIVKQFDAYEIEPGIHHNGKLVAGESIADFGGLVIAWDAWQRSLKGKPKPPVVDGFTPEQRFFLGFARARAANATPESLRLRIATDPHPANKFRVNGPLSNMPQFATAFGCKAIDPMVRPPDQRCDIW
jgi:putative endopeptidase